MERIREQEAALRTIVQHAVTTAPAVREAFAAARLAPGDIHLADLERIPITRKEHLPARQAQALPFGGWLAQPLGDVRRIFVSPGPIYEPEGRSQDYWGFVPALYAAGFRAGDVVVNSFSYHLTPAGHMFDGALDVLGCVVVPAGVGNTEIQVKTLLDVAATAFIGTPSFLATVLRRLAELGHRSPIDVAFVSGEPLPETLRQELEEAYAVRISQGYATADVGLIAYECSERVGFHLADRVLVEIVDPATGARCSEGDPGEVVVSYLSELYPLLRLGTGDLSRSVRGPCACGRTAPRLERIIGRIGEAVKVRGLFLHPGELDRALARHPEVTRYQAVVTRTGVQDEVTVRVETGASNHEVLRAAIEETVRQIVRLRASIEVLAVGTLPQDAKKLVDRRVWT